MPVARFLVCAAIIAGSVDGALEFALARGGTGFETVGETAWRLLLGVSLHGGFALVIAALGLPLLGIIARLDSFAAASDRRGVLALRGAGAAAILGLLFLFRTASGSVGPFLVSALCLPVLLLPKPAWAIAAALLGYLGLRSLDPLLAGEALEGTFVNYSPAVIEPMICLVLVAFFYLLAFAILGTRRARGGGVWLGVIALVAISLTIHRLSFVFLVRLSVFPAMDYLTVTALVGSILCLWTSTAFVVARSARGPQALAAMLPAVLLALLGGTAAVAIHMAAAPTLFLHAQRSLPGTRWLVERLQPLVDRDRDGFASLFGGGDCNDADPAANPNRLDAPLDGVDENCLGGDFDGSADPYLSLDAEFVVTREHEAPRTVVLVTIDAMRADALGRKGRDGASLTPALDALGRTSAVYENAIAPSSYTQSSIPYLIAFATRAPGVLRPALHLPRILAGAEARSVAVLSDSRPWGTVDPYIDSFEKRLPPGAYAWNADQLADEAIRVLHEPRDGSLLLWVHFPNLHDYDLFGERSIFAWNVTDLSDAGVNLSILADLLDLDDMSRKLRRIYEAQLVKVDAAVARLWNELRRTTNAADTLFIVTADHGEEFLDHGGFFHGGTLYQEALHVPLIVHGAAFPAAKIAAPVALYRLPATILDWFGFRGVGVESVSLRAGEQKDLPVFASSNHLGRKPPAFALVEYPLKLIYERAGGLEELYDLAADPAETRNLVDEPAFADRRRDLERKLDRVMFHFEYGPERVAADAKRPHS